MVKEPDLSGRSLTVDDWYRQVPADLSELAHRLRDLIYEVADEVDAAPLIEELKWGQPSYRSPHGNESTPVRVGWTSNGDIALLAHCQTSVVPNFRATHGNDFRFDKNRAVLINPADLPQVDDLADFVIHALTYRREPPPPS